MSDTPNTLATASGATPVAAKTIRSHGIINQKQARTLARAELAAAAAQHPDRVNTMTVRGILPEYAESVVTDVGAARDKVALIVNSTTARKVATAAEARTAEFLLDGLREVQKAAKQKYARTKPVAQLEHRPHDLLLQMVVLAVHEVGNDLAVQRKLLEGVLLRHLGDALDTVFDDAAATDDLFAIDSDLAGVGSGLGNFAQGGIKARKIALARSIAESHGGNDVVHHGFS